MTDLDLPGSEGALTPITQGSADAPHNNVEELAALGVGEEKHIQQMESGVSSSEAVSEGRDDVRQSEGEKSSEKAEGEGMEMQEEREEENPQFRPGAGSPGSSETPSSACLPSSFAALLGYSSSFASSLSISAVSLPLLYSESPSSLSTDRSTSFPPSSALMVSGRSIDRPREGEEQGMSIHHNTEPLRKREETETFAAVGAHENVGSGINGEDCECQRDAAQTVVEENIEAEAEHRVGEVGAYGAGEAAACAHEQPQSRQEGLVNDGEWRNTASLRYKQALLQTHMVQETDSSMDENAGAGTVRTCKCLCELFCVSAKAKCWVT